MRDHVGQQSGGRCGGGRDDHAVGLDQLRGGCRSHLHLPAGLRGRQAPDRRARADLHPAAHQRRSHRTGHAPDTPHDAPERQAAPGTRGLHAATGHPLGRAEQRSVMAQLAEQRRHRGLHRQRVGATGVDPTEQWLDESVHDLPADAGGDELTDGDVLAHRCRRDDPVEGYAQQAGGRQDLAGGQGPQVRGDPHELSPRHRPDPAAAEHGGLEDARRHEVVLETDLTGQAQRLRPARDERLRALVHGDPRHVADRELPADVGGGLEQRHLDVGVGAHQVPRGGQARDAPADDDDVPARCRDRRRRGRTGGCSRPAGGSLGGHRTTVPSPALRRATRPAHCPPRRAPVRWRARARRSGSGRRDRCPAAPRARG